MPLFLGSAQVCKGLVRFNSFSAIGGKLLGALIARLVNPEILRLLSIHACRSGPH